MSTCVESVGTRRTGNPVVRNALSVDVEEYYHAVIFQEGTIGLLRSSLESRVEGSVDRILALMSEHHVRATFFTLGQVAEVHPKMITRIADEGHEVACHGYGHELVFRQSSQEFRDDVRRGKIILEDLIGKAVIGYRAPNYSIYREQQWAYDILLEEGFRYDSSVYPILHDRYGYPDAPRFPYTIRQTEQGDLVEFPIGTIRFGGVNLPLGGGGYFRLLPQSWFCYGIRFVNRREGRPLMFFFHPWELDPDQPRLPTPWHHRFRHYVGQRKEEDKLARLLQSCCFTPARSVLGFD